MSMYLCPLYFQDTLTKMFSSIQDVKKYKAFVVFACSLMNNPEILIDSVLTNLATNINQCIQKGKGICQIQASINQCWEFLQVMYEEISYNKSETLINRKLIEVVTGGIEFVLVPNKFWGVRLSGLSEKYQGMKYSDNECACITNNLSSLKAVTLDNITSVYRYPNVVSTSLGVFNDNISESHGDDIVREALERLKIFTNTKMVVIDGFRLPSSVSDHVLSLLCYCENLERLHIRETKGVCVELGEAISKMTSLRTLDVLRCRISPDVRDVIFKAVPNYHNLEHLAVSGNALTDCMEDILGGYDHPGFPSLKMLNVREAKLSRNDVMTIAAASHSGKLPQLERLDLGNNCLTDVVRFLVNGITLSSFRDLTNVVRFLVAEVTLPPLRVLIMNNAKLIGSDLVCLSEGIASGKLPKLGDLNLTSNNLGSMEQDVKNLIVSCVGQYKQTHLHLCLEDNSLSEKFKEEIKSLCQGTNIKLYRYYLQSRREIIPL